MIYIIKAALHFVNFKHGYDLYLVLGLANYMNIHTPLNFISLEQFYNDIGYLYNALKQALKSKGNDLIVQQKHNSDGIVLFHNLVQKYRYGRDMETYKTKL